jgi:tungstate transport system substrate-binding protein
MRKLALLAAPLVAAVMLFLPGVSSADTSSSLTVVGTSDVQDSGLIPNLIAPDFHALYPQYTFKYVPGASGTAITEAESGSEGASVLLVHAASLENQFVAGGYSYNNQYGYAIFRNDFVLAGPSSDPAGVTANASDNIAQAYADIAAAGINGDKVSFVSRANTSGTAVAEHQIWALVQSDNLAPAGLLLCTLSTANGGGDAPVASGQGVTASGQQCPNNGAIPGTASGASVPTWYIATGSSSQGANVLDANACTYPSGANTCYVFTDRGTYDYLTSGLANGNTPQIPNLKIVTRGPQPSTAPGGVDELINYFHAYIVSPSKVPAAGVNLTAAQDFISLLTSPSFQSQLASYLDNVSSDTGGPPFVADASPDITELGLQTEKLAAGKSVTVTGTVTNAEPGYPALSDVPVAIDEIVAGVPIPVATGHTSSTGTFSIAFTPTSSGEYQVATGQLSVVENSYLSPVFGDTLSPAASAEYDISLTGIASETVAFSKVKISKGTVTVSGTLKPGTSTKGATVSLYGLSFATGKEKRLGKASIGVGKTTFSIKVKLSRHTRYALQLEYAQKGQTSSYSGLKSIKTK